MNVKYKNRALMYLAKFFLASIFTKILIIMAFISAVTSYMLLWAIIMILVFVFGMITLWELLGFIINMFSACRK
jgi:hypothetical protein